MYRIKFWIQTQIDFFSGLGLGPDSRPKPNEAQAKMCDTNSFLKKSA